MRGKGAHSVTIAEVKRSSPSFVVPPPLFVSFPLLYIRSVSLLSFWLRLSKIIGASAVFLAFFRDWTGCLHPSHDWATNRLFWLKVVLINDHGSRVVLRFIEELCIVFIYFTLFFEERKIFIIYMLVFMDDLTFLFIKAHHSLNGRTQIIMHVNKTFYWIKHMDNIINLNAHYF